LYSKNKAIEAPCRELKAKVAWVEMRSIENPGLNLPGLSRLRRSTQATFYG